jgi:glycosyltransferase involved in cell wall biosynthesis
MIRFIIPAYNAEKTIYECLTSILAQEYEKEVIVVDNGSSDRTNEIIKEFPVKYIYEPIKGPSAARNRGLAEAGNFQYIAFVDSDAVLPADWAINAIILLEISSDIAGVGGPGKSIIKNSISETFDYLLYNRASGERDRSVMSLATMDVMYKPDCIKGVVFNESLMAAEDPDFNFRIIKKGYKLIYSNKLWVFHYNPTEIQHVIKKWFSYGKFYPKPYFLNRKLANFGLWARILYLPLVISACLISIFLKNYIPLILIVISFPLIYFWLGLKVGIFNFYKLLMFVLVHSLKQFAQILGIWWGFVLNAVNFKKWNKSKLNYS